MLPITVKGCHLIYSLDMNDLDNLQDWNIHPEQRGNGIKWNHALLVLLLGLAAYRKHLH